MNLKTKTEFLRKNSNTILTLAVFLVCLLLFNIFPTDKIFEDLTKMVFFLVAVPALFLRFVMKKNLSAYGLNLKNKKAGVFWGAIAFISYCVLSFFLIQKTSLKENYLLSPGVIGSFWYFIFYEFAIVSIFVFSYECFFRGFLMFTFKKEGILAMILQFIVFLAMLFFTGGLSWQYAPFILTAAGGAVVAMKSKSVAYSFISAFLFMVIFDAYIISLTR